jgi:pyruvate-formate lyase-activating enzyme
LPYHKIGSSKYKRFNIPHRMEEIEPPTNERMLKLKMFFGDTGIKVKIGG